MFCRKKPRKGMADISISNQGDFQMMSLTGAAKIIGRNFLRKKSAAYDPIFETVRLVNSLRCKNYFS